MLNWFQIMHFESVVQFAFDFVDVIYIFINDQKIIHIHDDVNFLVLVDQYVVVKIDKFKAQWFEKVPNDFISHLKWLFQFIQCFDETTNQCRIFNKFVRLNDVNDLIKQFIKKDDDYVHLLCMQSLNCNYYKKNSKKRWFDYFCSCFVIVDVVFLFIIIYHSTSFKT